MDVQQIVDAYYGAWIDDKGDMSSVPLALDLHYQGPIASFTDSAGFTAMARQAGAAVTAFRVRRQFVDGDTVCTIIDWEMAMLPGQALTSAEILEIRGGEIVRGELVYDAEQLRKAMAAAAAE